MRLKNLKFYYSVGASILSVFLLAALALFMYGKIISLKANLFEIENQIGAFDLKQKNARDFKIFLETRSADFAVIDTAFVDENSLIKFIEDVEKVAKESRVTLKVTTSGRTSPNAKNPPEFSLSASGNFENTLQYLLLLENMPYELVFKRINLASQAVGGQQSGGIWRASYQLRLESFSF